MSYDSYYIYHAKNTWHLPYNDYNVFIITDWDRQKGEKNERNRDTEKVRSTGGEGDHHGPERRRGPRVRRNIRPDNRRAEKGVRKREGESPLFFMKKVRTFIPHKCSIIAESDRFPPDRTSVPTHDLPESPSFSYAYSQ